MNMDDRIFEILGQAKLLAGEYRTLTGKPLGITGEIAEYEVKRCLGYDLSKARQSGFDAVRPSDNRTFQVKGRCLLPGCKSSQMLDSIDTTKDFDAVLLVTLDEKFDAIEIFEADRHAVIAALTAPGSKARNERGALSISKFKRIGERVWFRPLN